ncbi:ribonuclease H protein [Pyrus ussuriensis x Pyrus communis]|uniref:Ribonuclease H protein n=1 Tax=Pyrus ussuriensis x Pyrus communis TaxID=2448454 RepID=A0A5N5FY27_9ROSA|nr:ribonuclease H protein [Pyrus ussuriensis x Pyrus communis]
MEQIKKVQIGDPSCDDQFIWPLEKRCKYTVKSGYHWIHSREAPIRHRRSSLLVSINKQVWKSIWKLEVHPKIRFFMWQILHRALATRCNAIFNQKTMLPLQVIHKINCGHAAFMEANKRSNMVDVGSGTSPRNQANLIRDSQSISVWSPPEISWYKVNVDANSNGKFIAARKQSILAEGVQEAEAKAILEGCKLANHLDLCNSIYQGRWEAVPVLWKAMQLKGSFQQCRWSWVPRSANMVAHRLAFAKCWFLIIPELKNPKMSNYTWVEKPPSSIVHILNKDGLPCPH